ncbi:hypothetical protein SAMN04487833_13718 [Sarcina sp. DSM 11001]|nr:hypothetical protein SAMN04487833_13718 [Sarcina sp. DSM 11001]
MHLPLFIKSITYANNLLNTIVNEPCYRQEVKDCSFLTTGSLRVSNEPCVDEKYCRRCELARKRIKDFSDIYGECRDSEQTPCVCEPVVMANCVPTESTTVRKT